MKRKFGKHCPYDGCDNEGWVLVLDGRRLCGVHGRAEIKWHKLNAELIALQLKRNRGASRELEKQMLSTLQQHMREKP